MGNAEAPVVRAVVICDHAIREDNGKISLIGIFSRIEAPAFPSIHGPVCLYLAVTNVRTSAQLLVQLRGPGEDETSQETLARLDGTLRADSPLAVAELVLKFPMPLERAGHHTIDISSEDEHLGATSFLVVRRQQQS